MEQPSLNLFELACLVDPDSVCLARFGHLTCLSNLDLELRSYIGSSAGSESGNMDATKSVINQEGISKTMNQIGATAVGDGGGGFDTAHFRDTMLGYDKQHQDVYDLHPFISPCESLANISPVIHFIEPTFSGEVVDNAPGFTRAATDGDSLPIKLERRFGPARHYHQLGICDETPEPDADQASGTQPNLGRVNALRRHPEERNSEIREATYEVKRLSLLPDANPSSHPQRISIPPRGTEIAIGPFTAAAQSTSTTGIKSPPIEEDWKASPSPSDSARKARMNETEGMILRMMPLSHEIHFDVDMESFWSAGFHQDTTDRIEYAARIVDREFRKHDLGIAFTYTPGPGPKAFRIRYDPNITGNTLALAFFPSDPRERWQVRISRTAALPWARGGHLECMRNILAHEFMHILGFRHWNAGFDGQEMKLPSVHLPGTVDRDRKSVMFTSVHDRLWFNTEDYRAIKTVYSAPSGDKVGGCLIVDVDPYV